MIQNIKLRCTVFNISKIQNESNSQQYVESAVTEADCVQYFKDTKWKQFTTQIYEGNIYQALCSIFQRYKMKAIHNKVGRKYFSLKTVFNISKIQNESNSQRRLVSRPDGGYCVQYFKDTKWKQFTTCRLYQCSSCTLCSIFQRYKMKAIHNWHPVPLSRSYTVFNISKIQNESNSQQIAK